MKIISLMFLAVILSGCGAMDRAGASITGYSSSCIDGVTYLQFASGATVKYNQNGTIVTCKK